MKDIIKRYLKFIWHYSQAYTLLTIPLSGFSIAMSFFTFVAVAFGFKLLWWEYVIFFLSVLLIISLLGILIVKAGFTAYYQSLSNKQSPELMEILRRIEGLEKKR